MNLVAHKHTNVFLLMRSLFCHIAIEFAVGIEEYQTSLFILVT